MSNALAIALFVGITLLFLLIRFAVHFAANKAEDAILTGIVRRSGRKSAPGAAPGGPLCPAGPGKRKKRARLNRNENPGRIRQSCTDPSRIFCSVL